MPQTTALRTQIELLQSIARDLKELGFSEVIIPLSAEKHKKTDEELKAVLDEYISKGYAVFNEQSEKQVIKASSLTLYGVNIKFMEE